MRPLQNQIIWDIYGATMGLIWFNLWAIYGSYMTLVWPGCLHSIIIIIIRTTLIFQPFQCHGPVGLVLTNFSTLVCEFLHVHSFQNFRKENPF